MLQVLGAYCALSVRSDVGGKRQLLHMSYGPLYHKGCVLRLVWVSNDSKV